MILKMCFVNALYCLVAEAVKGLKTCRAAGQSSEFTLKNTWKMKEENIGKKSEND